MEEETLKIRVEGIQIKDLLSEDIKNKFEENIEMDLGVANLVFASEDGIIVLTHDNPEKEEKGIVEIEADSENRIENFKNSLEEIFPEE